MEPNRPRICVSICESSLDAIRLQAARAAEVADLIELRVDCLEPSQAAQSLSELKALLPQIPVPVIVTYRPSEQGGHSKLSAKLRLLFWLFNRPAADFFDVEFDIATTPSVFNTDKHLDWDRVISSYHDFRDTPADLMTTYERMSHTRARTLKIAFQAHDAIDCLPAFELLDRGLRDGYQMIAIAMGTAGLATRILGPSRGAFLTYASLDDEKQTAPGQITVRDLREVYRIDGINRQTQITGLIGLPVSHSVSPFIHNAAFAHHGMNAVYLPLEVADLKSFINRMVHPRTRELDWNLRGLSVTAPHKTAVMDHLDWIDPVAQEIGAVNTIVVEDDQLRGYNTDAAGLLAPLLQRLSNLNGLRCAVIGSGGSAKAAVWSLRQQNADVTVFARNPAKGEALAQRFGAAWKPLGDALFADYSLVVNTTPLGSAGRLEQETPVTSRQLAGASFVYDLVYNPHPTRLLREAKSAGCEVLHGLEMLVGQAAEQFRLWTGTAAPESVMLNAAERALNRTSSDLNF